MEISRDYHIEILERELTKRQRINRAYSIRSFARFLGLSQSSLTQILKRNRYLPKKHAEQVAERLLLTPTETNKFVRSVLNKKKTLIDELYQNEKHFDGYLDPTEHFNIIAEWEYAALICLSQTKDFVSDERWIARRLNISLTRTREIIRVLLKVGLAEFQDGEFKTIHKNLKSTEDIPNLALKKAQLENCDLAKEKYLETSLEDKYYGLTTLSINRKKIDRAKTLIRSFRRALMDLLEDGTQDEVYQLTVQLFPLSSLKERGEL